MNSLNSVQPNRILARLVRSDLDLLRPHLQPVDLPVRMQLERPNQSITDVYFPESGFASVVTNGSGPRSVEVGLIGREGMTGLAVVLGTDRTPQETFMQSAGKGQKAGAGALRRSMDESASLRQCLLRFAHVFMVQMACTCLSNRRGKIEERLARWLLMAHDRSQGDDLHITHEFLSCMLGVRRPGVSIAVGSLENRGLIRTTRGSICLLDRAGLEEAANGTYGTAEAEQGRLFGL
jgi:CRP-like cAMP-binding protein